MEDEKIQTVCNVCLDWEDFSSGEHSDYPCDGCRFAEEKYKGDRSPRIDSFRVNDKKSAYWGNPCPECGTPLEFAPGSDSIGTPGLVCPECGESVNNQGYEDALKQ